MQFLLFLNLADSFPQPRVCFHTGELSDFEETIKKQESGENQLADVIWCVEEGKYNA